MLIGHPQTSAPHDKTDTETDPDTTILEATKRLHQDEDDGILKTRNGELTDHGEEMTTKVKERMNQ